MTCSITVYIQFVTHCASCYRELAFVSSTTNEQYLSTSESPSHSPPLSLLQQLQEELGRRNMLYWKQHLQLTKVIGEGEKVYALDHCNMIIICHHPPLPSPGCHMLPHYPGKNVCGQLAGRGTPPSHELVSTVFN